MTDYSPGSPAWKKLITASKVAAILGVSKWDSPRSMWNIMAGVDPGEEQNDEQARGHYLEAGVLAWFFDHHPELERLPDAGTIFHPMLPWAAATPDAVARNRDTGEVVAVDAKTDADGTDWGKAGTDEIPAYYAAQGMWTCHVLGTGRIYFPLLSSRLLFCEYVLDYRPGVGGQIEARCKAFLDSIAANVPPPIDGHLKTFESLKRMNPDIEDWEVQLDTDLAREFVVSRQVAKAATARELEAKSRVVEAMGTAKVARCGDQMIARRQNTANGGAALYPPRRAVDLDQLPKAAA